MPATNLTVNGSLATPYQDNPFTATVSVTNGWNTFTAIGRDAAGRSSTDVSTVNVQTNNSAYHYDLNGNLLTDGTRNFAYDDENQLIGVWRANAWNAGTGWQLTNEVHFVYDGNLVVQELDANNQTVVSYTRGLDLSATLQGAGGIGGLLARSDRAQVVPWVSTGNPGVPQPIVHSYYHADGNGNITALISGGQMLMAKYLYDPYGNLLAKSGLLADLNNYRFSSKEWNGNSGLYYYLYRFYDPSLQRWPNRDPLGEPGFEVLNRGSADPLGDGPNLYAYVKNDPIDRMDPRGLDGEATLGLDPTLLMDEEETAAFRAQQCKCAALAAAVQAAKAAVGALGGPKSGDSCAVLKAKTAAWLALAVARSRLNQSCFGGGDAGHQQATADAWANVGKGIALQTEKGCVGSPTH